MNIHERMEEQISLAKCYAEDGAFASAARVLRGLALEVQAHAEACAKAEADMIAREGL